MGASFPDSTRCVYAIPEKDAGEITLWDIVRFDRHLRVQKLAIEGMSNSQIAKRLGVSHHPSAFAEDVVRFGATAVGDRAQ